MSPESRLLGLFQAEVFQDTKKRISPGMNDHNTFEHSTKALASRGGLDYDAITNELDTSGSNIGFTQEQDRDNHDKSTFAQEEDGCNIEGKRGEDDL